MLTNTQSDEYIRKIVTANSDSNIMLLLNGRYYCQLTADNKSLNVPEHYYYFSGLWKETNFKAWTQYANCYILDAGAENVRYTRQFAKLYHTMHHDLNSHAFSLLLEHDNTLISITSIEIIEKATFIEMTITDEH